MKAILIDDEKEARESLKMLLHTHCRSVNVIAEAKDGLEGLDMIRRLAPDLVFLDLEMPGMSGFQLLEALGTVNFALIFVTAYNQYAIRAFDFSATGYLLKPVDKDKLQNAVMEARERLAHRNLKEHYEVLLEVLKSQNSQGNHNHRISFRNQEEVFFIQMDDLIRIEADGSISYIYAFGHPKKIIESRNLGQYEDMFQGVPRFMRVHRSHLVNLKHAKKFVRALNALIMPSPDGGPDAQVPVSPKYRDDVINWTDRL